MTKTGTKPRASFSQRCRTLNTAAHGVRQQATLDGDDFEGWRLSRLMRDAHNDTQVNIAELKYGVWLQANDGLFLAKSGNNTAK
jgi:hypothetical protein